MISPRTSRKPGPRPPARSCRGVVLWFATLLSLGLPALRAAQGADSETLPDVVVTASKRTSTLIEVPMSVTVLDAATLERSGVSDFNDYALKAPNVSFSYAGGQGITESRTIAIRGINGLDTTGFYLNDLPLPPGVDPHVFDLARIEVLRGPQGTLYGANSMGGTVRLITHAPDPDAFSGTVHGSASGMDHGGNSYQAEGGVNLPLGSTAALRMNAYSTRDGGFQNRRFPDLNAPTGLATVPDIARLDSYGANITLLWNPTDSLSIQPQVLYQHARRNGLPLADYDSANQIQQRLFDIEESTDEKWTIAGLTVNWRLPLGEITSASSYFNRKDFELEEASDWTAAVLGYSPVLPTAIPTYQPEHDFVQEIRFGSTFPGPLQLVAGLYYADRHFNFEQPWTIPGLAEVDGGVFGTDLAYFFNGDLHTRQKAAFGEATYTIGKWSLTAGVRTSDQSWRRIVAADGVFNGGPSQSDMHTSERSTIPKFAIHYGATPDQSYYALVSQGFRPGAANTPLPDICAQDLANLGLTFSDVSSYKADKVKNYEVGAKTRLLDRRLSANVGVFYIDWTSIKQLVKLPLCGFAFNGNGAAARSQGAELELSALLARGLTLMGGVGYTDAKITRASATNPAAPGTPVQQVAPWTANLALEYDYPLTSEVGVLLRADAVYSDHSFSAANDQLHPRVRASYSIVNLRAGITHGRYEFSTFVQNFTNARPNLADDQSQAGELEGRPRYVTIPPRRIGVDVRMHF